MSRRSMNDAVWAMTLPMADDEQKGPETCQICSHDIRPVIACQLAAKDCDDKGERKHLHCIEQCRCTMGGCMPVKREVIHLSNGFL